MKKYGILFLLAFLVHSCGDLSSTSVSEQAEVPGFTITPPVDSLTKQTEQFTIDNSTDTVLITDHGSFIHIPENCFVNSEGAFVKAVEIAFTEHQNVSDIFFSGIPMSYVDDKDTMTFQSAGMCEINATSEGNNLTIAANKKIDIGMRNSAKDGNYNLYYFDETSGQWIEEQQNLVVDTTALPKPPVNPEDIDTNRIVNVNILNAQNRERFSMWDGTKFYLLPDQQPKYAAENIFWYEMTVEETIEPDVFVLSFKGAKDGNQYREILITQPIPKKGQYELALSEFQEKMRQQTKVILANNEKVRKEKLAAEDLAVQIEKEHKEQLYQDSIKFARYDKAVALTAEVTRTFSINQLGIYNCDRFYTRPIIAEKEVNFTYDDSPVDLHYSALCHPRDNVVLRSVPKYGDNYQIKLSEGDYYFVGVSGDHILCAALSAQNLSEKKSLQKISKQEFEKLISR